MSFDSPRQTRRREKLRLLLGSDQGAQAALAREIGTPKSHLSAILAGRRGIGDALAAKIERHFEKPAGWLDEAIAERWLFSTELYERVASLNPQELQRLETAMRVHLGMDLQMDVINRSLAKFEQQAGDDFRATRKDLGRGGSS